MADHTDQDAERAAVREWWHAEQARIAAISDEEWAAKRDDELRVVRECAAARRRSAA